ncbi:MAG: hypothetical protein A3H96_08650 [Acidobacteria bacterium RIFCSPLOWO2_02_FULL_67_36]|nr:MAG: hypothetical protein A3H96_08650 [Acidobacteria bacterium RIFCSPLOWO2_02_FULL_67_36]OFW21093.1 MAG: hypothetical protein A3G21_14330 [Acidobacteria bacterium RIFCSPLOWO2_12_FULL_66_21]
MVRPGKRNNPEVLVTAPWVALVPSSFSTTVAPGTTASDVSLTVPVIAPVVRTCAHADVTATSAAHPGRPKRTALMFGRLLRDGRMQPAASGGDQGPLTGERACGIYRGTL